MRFPSFVAAIALAAAAVAACGQPANETAHTTARHAASDAPATSARVIGDEKRGEALVTEFECARCHVVPSGATLPKEQQCVGCHADINAGSITAATPDQRARWQGKVAGLGDAPSLAASGSRFRRAWIQGFLLHPHDLRPALIPTMPRLALTEQQAADLATYLSPIDTGTDDDVASALKGADADAGRTLLDSRGCGVCHRMTGVPDVKPSAFPPNVEVTDMGRALRLAPDLRFARDRLRPERVVAWILHPKQIKPDTMMPDLGLTLAEAKNVAAYLFTTPLGPPVKVPVPARLPVLERKVTYDEVATRVFRKTCWHCHGEPDFERGNGGPGNSGGFGFKGRRLDLSDYESTFAGYIDDTGKRVSIFATEPDGTPRVVAAMLARQQEETGVEGVVRGMPLGLPSVTPEEIQLVETWIAQGRAR